MKGKDRYEMNVGYGRHRLDDARVKAYADACWRRAGKDPYRAHDRLSEYVGQVESLDRRQFLNCVLDSLQRHFD